MLFSFFAFAFVGCSQWQAKRQLKLFYNTEVLFPVDLEVDVKGKLQNSPQKLLSRPIKLAIYYSANRCSSCEIDRLLVFYDLFILAPDRFTPVIIMSTDDTKYEEIVSMLQIRSYTFPVFVDKDNEFLKLNSNIPQDMRYHTFLLDKNNKIVLVGNPMDNNTMWELFRSTLDNMLVHDGIYVSEQVH